MTVPLDTLQDWVITWDKVRARMPRQFDYYCRDVWLPAPDGGPPLRMNVMEMGPKDAAQTLLMVHGLNAAVSSFAPLLPLTRTHRVLAVDLRGHGRSSWPSGGYTVAQMAEDLVAALDVLHYDAPLIVVGSSAGGIVAAEFALRYPERVSRLVLIVTPVALREERLPGFMRGFMNLPDGVFRLMAAFPALNPSGAGMHPGIKRYYQDLARWDGPRKYPQIRQPTLVITGIADNLLGPNDFTQVAELIPNAELVNVKAADHMMPFERPHALLRAIERFIDPDPSDRFEPRWRSENDDVDSRRLLAERPWVARYGEGVPPTLDVPPAPLTRLLDVAAGQFGKRPALRYGGRTLTYAALRDEANRFATAVRQHGIVPGDRVLLALPNGPHWVVAFFGTLRAGAIAVLAQAHEPCEPLLERARQSGARLLVTMEADAVGARQVMAASEVERVVLAGEQDYARGKAARRVRPGASAPGGPELSWKEFMAVDVPSFVADSAGADDTAAMLFTSGVGGLPAGVRLSHRNLLANALQVGAWLPEIRPGQASILSAVPFGHAYGLAVGVNAALFLAATLVVPPDFSVETVLQQVRRERPTVLVAAPSHYIAMGSVPGLRKVFERGPRLCISGASRLPVEARETFERLAHARVVEGFERSETGQLALNPLQESRTGAAGLPLPGADARIVDREDGRPLPAGAIGELAVRGPQVMTGYWPEGAGVRNFDAEHWLHTGELASIDDDGYLRVLGRIDDVWTTPEGEAVYPCDVEETIYELPEVQEVVVAAFDNVPVAFIQLKPGERLTAERVLAFCRRRLPPGHEPQTVIFVDEFPRNPVGRIVRHALACEYGAQIRRAAAVEDFAPLPAGAPQPA